MEHPAHLTRRRTLALAAAALIPRAVPGLGALAAPAILRAEAAEGLAAIIARSGLGAFTGAAVADAATGRILEVHQPDFERPPASVIKIVTALFALETLGASHRFVTALRATGPVEGGTLAGDLVLAGGGDPVLDTDGLGDLVARLAGAGVVRVAGGLAVDGAALPSLAVTEAGQPAHVGYNPAIAGINLNFNRVALSWAPGTGGPQLSLTAPGPRHGVPVGAVRAELGTGAVPVHRLERDAEIWVVPRSMANGTGSAWLPVRRPEGYAADVCGRLLERANVAIAGNPSRPGPGGRILARHESPELATLMRGMLEHSTNLTAEVAGLAAARRLGAPPTSLAGSAAAMTEWARARWELGGSDFVNHSGLTLRSRMTARDALAVLVAEAETLPPLLQQRPILNARGEPMRGPSIRAKTGTMHFLRALAGYVEGNRRLAFAIFAAAPERRGDGDAAASAPPPGARDWLASARRQENALLRRWASELAG